MRTITSFGYPLAGSANLQPVWCYTLLNLAAATTILLLCRADGLPRLARVLRHPLLQRVGEVSYGMYLFHWGIGYGLQHVIGDTPAIKALSFVPYFALVYGLAYVSYHGFEKRLLELRAVLPEVASQQLPAAD